MYDAYCMTALFKMFYNVATRKAESKNQVTSPARYYSAFLPERVEFRRACGRLEDRKAGDAAMGPSWEGLVRITTTLGRDGK